MRGSIRPPISGWRYQSWRRFLGVSAGSGRIARVDHELAAHGGSTKQHPKPHIFAVGEGHFDRLRLLPEGDQVRIT